MARPRKQIDPKKIEALAAVGCTSEEIGLLLDAGARTIQRYGEPLKRGTAKLKHTIKRELIKQTLAGNTAAMIFAAKVYCGLKEHGDTVFNVSATATGGHITISDEQKKELSRMARIIRHQAFAETGASPNGANGDPAQN